MPSPFHKSVVHQHYPSDGSPQIEGLVSIDHPNRNAWGYICIHVYCFILMNAFFIHCKNKVFWWMGNFFKKLELTDDVVEDFVKTKEWYSSDGVNGNERADGKAKKEAVVSKDKDKDKGRDEDMQANYRAMKGNAKFMTTDNGMQNLVRNAMALPRANVKAYDYDARGDNNNNNNNDNDNDNDDDQDEEEEEDEEEEKDKGNNNNNNNNNNDNNDNNNNDNNNNDNNNNDNNDNNNNNNANKNKHKNSNEKMKDIHNGPRQSQMMNGHHYHKRGLLDILELTNTDQGMSSLAHNAMTQPQLPSHSSSSSPIEMRDRQLFAPLPFAATTDDGMQQLAHNVMLGKHPPSNSPHAAVDDVKMSEAFSNLGRSQENAPETNDLQQRTQSGFTETYSISSTESIHEELSNDAVNDHAKANEMMLKQLHDKITSEQRTPGGAVATLRPLEKNPSFFFCFLFLFLLYWKLKEAMVVDNRVAYRGFPDGKSSNDMISSSSSSFLKGSGMMSLHEGLMKHPTYIGTLEDIEQMEEGTYPIGEGERNLDPYDNNPPLHSPEGITDVCLLLIAHIHICTYTCMHHTHIYMYIYIYVYIIYVYVFFVFVDYGNKWDMPKHGKGGGLLYCSISAKLQHKIEKGNADQNETPTRNDKNLEPHLRHMFVCLFVCVLLLEKKRNRNIERNKIKKKKNSYIQSAKLKIEGMLIVVILRSLWDRPNCHHSNTILSLYEKERFIDPFLLFALVFRFCFFFLSLPCDCAS
ncbi:hypothetical protein RFI_30281 [Reticulomyxa filosa]|uniref:Uncharacterized protein n=1 Tax=Reticulomyxa filosa TaxID=46433 RepID=X6M118_RETFI|nr:hypothetical protein RFI_30281 [Reticulomyxa filosa]|eukprot:ETO07112.1 hypothetical protein RFI_30281 [Reticulomyxa filosa]